MFLNLEQFDGREREGAIKLVVCSTRSPLARDNAEKLPNCSGGVAPLFFPHEASKYFIILASWLLGFLSSWFLDYLAFFDLKPENIDISVRRPSQRRREDAQGFLSHCHILW